MKILCFHILTSGECLPVVCAAATRSESDAQLFLGRVSARGKREVNKTKRERRARGEVRRWLPVEQRKSASVRPLLAATEKMRNFNKNRRKWLAVGAREGDERREPTAANRDKAARAIKILTRGRAEQIKREINGTN